MNELETVVLVDKFDNQLGTEEKIRAHALGLLHRAFSVFVLRQDAGETQILMQQRNADKYHCGNLWTNTCCSHPRVNESILAAAQRRLHEEMGISLALQCVGNFTYRAEFSNGLVEHEFDHVLIGHYDGAAININPAEVQDYKWMYVKELQLDLQQNSQIYTPWLAGALAVLLQEIPR